jgi:hypothetical protein
VPSSTGECTAQPSTTQVSATGAFYLLSLPFPVPQIPPPLSPVTHSCHTIQSADGVEQPRSASATRAPPRHQRPSSAAAPSRRRPSAHRGRSCRLLRSRRARSRRRGRPPRRRARAPRSRSAARGARLAPWPWRSLRRGACDGELAERYLFDCTPGQDGDRAWGNVLGGKWLNVSRDCRAGSDVGRGEANGY